MGEKNMAKNSKVWIIYLHGYGSNGNTEKSAILKEHFEHVFSPTLSLDPNEVSRTLHTLLKDVIDNPEFSNDSSSPIVLVGTSLGGFLARYF